MRTFSRIGQSLPWIVVIACGLLGVLVLAQTLRERSAYEREEQRVVTALSVAHRVLKDELDASGGLWPGDAKSLLRARPEIQEALDGRAWGVTIFSREPGTAFRWMQPWVSVVGHNLMEYRLYSDGRITEVAPRVSNERRVN